MRRPYTEIDKKVNAVSIIIEKLEELQSSSYTMLHSMIPPYLHGTRIFNSLSWVYSRSHIEAAEDMEWEGSHHSR